MTTQKNKATTNVMIIGAGNASITLLQYFSRNDLVNVTGVVDINNNAPGIILAEKLGIKTSNDFKTFIKDVTIIMELTGVPKILAMIKDELKDNQNVISAASTWFLCQVIDGIQSRQTTLLNKLHEVNIGIKKIIESVEQNATDMNELLLNLNMLSVNGEIVAAQALSSEAKGFAIIIQEMERQMETAKIMVDQVQNSAKEGQDLISLFNKIFDELSN